MQTDQTTFLDILKNNLSKVINEEMVISKSEYAKNFWETGDPTHNFYENYFEQNNKITTKEITMDLRSLNPKLIITVIPGISHLFLDRFSIIIEWFKRNKNGNAIIFYDEGQWHKQEDKDDLFYFFKLFNDYVKNTSNNLQKCLLIEINNQTKIIINNYVIFKNYLNLIGKYHRVSNLKKIRDFYSSDLKPFRKVYISRQKTPHKPIYFTTGTNIQDLINLNRFDDERCENEENLENYLKTYGYEIIYPEDFENMEKQIKFFSEVKKLICLTHSGISNMIWLPDNSSVIEISVPLIVNKEEIFETMWNHLAFCAQHHYTMIPSFSGTAEDIINKIENNLELKKYIFN